MTFPPVHCGGGLSSFVWLLPSLMGFPLDTMLPIQDHRRPAAPHTTSQQVVVHQVDFIHPESQRSTNPEARHEGLPAYVCGLACVRPRGVRRRPSRHTRTVCICRRTRILDAACVRGVCVSRPRSTSSSPVVLRSFLRPESQPSDSSLIDTGSLMSD